MENQVVPPRFNKLSLTAKFDEKWSLNNVEIMVIFGISPKFVYNREGDSIGGNKYDINGI